MTDLLTPTESELAALADGALQGERRGEMLQAISDSAELTAALREQRRALELIEAASVKAPASLHRRVEEMIGRSGSRRRAWGLPSHLPGVRIFSGAAAGLAAAAVALAVTISGGGSGPLTVQQAAALTLSSPTMPAPHESAVNRTQLDVSVEGVPFPYWKERFGWRSAGARMDRLAGHTVTTVFYSDAEGRRIGYAIASGTAVPTHGGTVRWRAGVPYRLLNQDGTIVVTWPRAGHLCVIAGRGVDAGTLLRLAWWRGDRATAA